MNEWCIYIALYCVLLYTQSALQSYGGGGGGSLLNHHQCAASTWMIWVYSLIFRKMLFSILNFSSYEMWTMMTDGKWNATWHFVYKLFCWCLSEVETLIERLNESWDVHSLFHIKTRSKEEGMITLTHAPRGSLNWGAYTAICHATLKSAKT